MFLLRLRELGGDGVKSERGTWHENVTLFNVHGSILIKGSTTANSSKLSHRNNFIRSNTQLQS